jgi:hypothetical protein
MHEDHVFVDNWGWADVPFDLRTRWPGGWATWRTIDRRRRGRYEGIDDTFVQWNIRARRDILAAVLARIRSTRIGAAGV